jgi:hypothetical protein
LFACDKKDNQTPDPHTLSGTWKVITNKEVYYNEAGSIIAEKNNVPSYFTSVGDTYAFHKDSVTIKQPYKDMPLHGKYRYSIEYLGDIRYIQFLISTTVPIRYELTEVLTNKMTWSLRSRNIFIEKEGVTYEATTGIYTVEFEKK